VQRQPRLYVRDLAPGITLTQQEEPGGELFLLLEGVLVVEVDGRVLAEAGPGSVLGERALLNGGKRTATLRAKTRCTVAVISARQPQGR
jgi:CRP-like cAMP-binding protein